MAELKLDREEQEILDSYENEEWVSIKSEHTVSKYQSIAKATLKKDQCVNIRISSRDLELLQERALREGIPYQTLMSSVLHKYVTGLYSEKGT
jgi:predicted DNA binding CopG/RHH family protein